MQTLEDHFYFTLKFWRCPVIHTHANYSKEKHIWRFKRQLGRLTTRGINRCFLLKVSKNVGDGRIMRWLATTVAKGVTGRLENAKGRFSMTLRSKTDDVDE